MHVGTYPTTSHTNTDYYTHTYLPVPSTPTSHTPAPIYMFSLAYNVLHICPYVCIMIYAQCRHIDICPYKYTQKIVTCWLTMLPPNALNAGRQDPLVKQIDCSPSVNIYSCCMTMAGEDNG